MNKYLLLTLSLPLALAQQTKANYTLEDLRKLQTVSGVAKTSESVIHALAPETTPGLQFIGNVANETNLLVSYALMDKPMMLRFTRVLDRVAAKESWQDAPQLDQEFMTMFAKEFAVEFSHGTTLEVVNLLSYMLIDYLMGTAADTTKERLMKRAAQITATAITKPLIDTAFLALNHTVNDEEDDETPELTQAYVQSLLQTLYTELAYQAAGEIIRQFAQEPAP